MPGEGPAPAKDMEVMFHSVLNPKGGIGPYDYDANERSLRSEGVNSKYARGVEMDGGVWLSKEPYNETATTAEVVLPADTPTAAGRVGGEVAALHTSVPPSAIRAVHQPWHGTYRYLTKDDEAMRQTLSGFNDDIGDLPTDRAVDEVKKDEAVARLLGWGKD